MYCVVMGDIINSKLIEDDAIESITASIKEVLNSINAKYFNYLVAPLGLVRGDAFEGVLLSQSIAPEIIKEIIKKFYEIEKTRVRIAVVVGQVANISNDRNESTGEAFYKALNRIEELKKAKSEHWFQILFDANSIAQPLIDSLFNLLTNITQEWTERQREIVFAMEDLYNNNNLTAKKLCIPVSVISKQLKAANYEAYQKAWSNLTKYLYNFEQAVVDDQAPEKSYTTYYSIAQRKIEQHLFEDALLLLDKSLSLAKEEFNNANNEYQLSIIYNGLAESYIGLNNYAEAEKCISKSLDLQKNLPKGRLEYAKTISLLGELYLLDNPKTNKNDFENAEKQFQKSIEIAITTVGERHPFILEFYKNFAEIYKYKNEYKTALDYLFKALFFYKNKTTISLGKAMVNYNIAVCYNELFDFKKAIKYGIAALNIYNELLPPKHEYIIEAQRLIKECSNKEEE